MINTITSVNHLGESLTIDLRRPEQSGFLLSSPSGLGPIGADIKTTPYSSGDGYIYNSAMSNQREIELPIIFWEYNEDGLTIEQLRKKLYKYFPVKKKVQLIIETDERVGAIEGYVQSCDTTIFEKQTSAKVSIVCPFPYFKEHSLDYMRKATVTFDGDKYISNIYYTGDVATGFITNIKNLDNSVYNGGFSINDHTLDIDVRRVSGMAMNDVLSINSIAHNVNITKISASQVKIKAFGTLISTPNEFPKLEPGPNTIEISKYVTSEPTFNHNIEILYPVLYEGL